MSALPAVAGARRAAAGGMPSLRHEALATEIVTGREGLQSLADEWRRLQRQTPLALLSPFQDVGWLKAWLAAMPAHAADGGRDAGWQPLTVLVRQGSRPVLLLPLQRDRHAGMKRLTWLGTPALQYGGFLVDGRVEEAVVADALERALAALETLRCDFIDFRLLPADAPFVRLVSEAGRTGARNAAYCIDMSSFDDWRAYELSLKRSTRRARHKRLNRLARQGELAFRVHEEGPRRHELLDIALGWKRAWLAARGESGSFAAGPAFSALMHALLDSDDEAGARWVVAELALDGKVIAVEAGAVMHGAFHAYLAAYDMDMADHSPGKALMWLMLKWCKESGIDIYDMLANHAPYKEEWANVMRPLVHVIRPQSVSGLAYGLWVSRLREVAREAYHSLPPSLRGLISANLRRLRDGHVQTPGL